MGFRYENSNDQRLTGTIADLMLRGPAARAAAAERIGEIQARGVQQSAGAWAGAAQNIGQQIGAIPAQLEQQKRQGVSDQLDAAKLRDVQRGEAGNKAVAGLMQGDQLPAGATGPRQDNYLDPKSGLFDMPKMTAALGQAGLGDRAAGLLKGAESINESILKHQELEQKAAAQHSILLGDLADGALKMHATGTPLDAAMDFVVQPALATKRIKPEEYAQVKQQIAQLPPEQQVAALKTLMDQAAQLGGGKTLGKDAQEVDRYGRVMVTNAPPDKPKTRAELAADAANPKSPTQTQSATALDLMAPPKPEPPPKAYQHVDKLLDGKPATLLLDPAPGGKLYDLSGAVIDNAASRVKPIPPASIQVNNQLAAGAKQEASAAEKAIGDYKVPGPSSRSMSTYAGKAQMDRILAYNPDYDASQFPARQKMRIQFSSGPQSQTINSINTAIGHLDQFVDVAKALDNGNFRPGNQAFNWLKATFGDSAPTNFEGIRSIMSGELASAFKKSGATDQEIKSVESAISSKNSTSQLVDYATKIAIPALGSKIAAFDQQYKQVMGAKDPFKVLTPDAEEVLAKYGFDPAHPRMGGGGQLTAQERARDVLVGAGKASDDAAIAQFLKNNPGFK